MIVNYNEVMRIHREAARFLAVPGVIHGSRTLLLSREDLRKVFGLTEKETENYADPVGLGYRPSHPEIRLRGRRMSVLEVRARLAEIHGTPPKKRVETHKGLSQKSFSLRR